MHTTRHTAQRHYIEAAERLGIHVDEVKSHMLARPHHCDLCGTEDLPTNRTWCDQCVDNRAALAMSLRPEAIAARQGCKLLYTDAKEEASFRNATADKHGRFGLSFDGGIL